MIIVKAIPKANATGEDAQGERQKSTNRKNTAFLKVSFLRVDSIVGVNFEFQQPKLLNEDSKLKYYFVLGGNY